jgi:hypothetical protein
VRSSSTTGGVGELPHLEQQPAATRLEHVERPSCRWSHTREQFFCFGPNGLLGRHDCELVLQPLLVGVDISQISLS